MELESLNVGFLRCASYQRERIKAGVEELCGAVDYRPTPGSRILLKPNLVMGRGHDGLACTHPEFVAAVAEWFVDQGARVAVGDSPAFGSARSVMERLGIVAGLKQLPVKLVDFNKGEQRRLVDGSTVLIAREVLECDQLINLPRLKAHSQMMVSLAVKNYFGSVISWRKAWAHMCQGREPARFAALLTAILAVMPSGISLLDGIIAMHRTGPTRGAPYKAGLIGASANPIALDRAVLSVIGLDPELSPLARYCQQNHLVGAEEDEIRYPLLTPEEIKLADFVLPAQLVPICFEMGHFLRSAGRRLGQYVFKAEG